MEKPVAVVEFGSKKIKLVVGFEIDGQPYVLYASTIPYGNNIDFNEAYTSDVTTQLVGDFRNFSDNSVKLKLSINEVLLSIPPFGLEIYDNQQITTVISDENKIANIDIRNIYALIRNGASSLQNELINIIPDSFVLDQGRSFSNPPIGEVSSTLTEVFECFTRCGETSFESFIKELCTV